MSRPQPRTRADFSLFLPISTRWMDNDVYGHINNVTYYSFFDTAVNRYLMECGVLDIAHSTVIGLVVETGCHYFSSLSFPDDIEAGISVAHIGGMKSAFLKRTRNLPRPMAISCMFMLTRTRGGQCPCPIICKNP
jgi:acyl-CoA thioesterase FadM